MKLTLVFVLILFLARTLSELFLEASRAGNVPYTWGTIGGTHEYLKEAFASQVLRTNVCQMGSLKRKTMQ